MSALTLGRRPSRLIARSLPPLGLAAGLWLLASRLPAFDARALWADLAGTPPLAWGIAILLTGLSFAAVGRTDEAVHRALGTGVAPRRARLAGMRAVALAQTLGFGGITGTLARWRSLPEIGPARAAGLTLGATAAFLTGTVVMAGALTLADGRAGAPTAALALLAVVALAARARPTAFLPGLSPRLILALGFWIAADLAAAAGAFAAFLPAEVGISRLAYAYAVALAAGFVSQSPGGAGVFEATLIALLPEVPAEDILAAAVAYRCVYHAGPALAALASFAAEPASSDAQALTRVEGRTLDGVLARAPQAEWGLAHQGAEARLSRDLSRGWLTRRAGGRMVAIGLALGRADVGALAATAAREGLRPLIYKGDARAALAARRSRWPVLRVGHEAILNLETWTAGAPACRQLRRKLRASVSAGVALRDHCPGHDLPLGPMRAVSDAWVGRQGTERGFSMGVFDPRLLGRQHVVAAWHEGALVAFASFHVGPGEWTLDLMRQAATAPDGAMHAIVAHAIDLARRDGARRLSLAAIPSAPIEVVGLVSPRARRWLGRAPWGWLRAGGLGQFKQSFGPRLSPRYAAAPTGAGLVLGLAAVARAIHRPEPLAGPPAPPRRVDGRRFELNVRTGRAMRGPLSPPGDPAPSGREGGSPRRIP